MQEVPLNLLKKKRARGGGRTKKEGEEKRWKIKALNSNKVAGLIFFLFAIL